MMGISWDGFGARGKARGKGILGRLLVFKQNTAKYKLRYGVWYGVRGTVRCTHCTVRGMGYGTVYALYGTGYGTG